MYRMLLALPIIIIIHIVCSRFIRNSGKDSLEGCPISVYDRNCFFSPMGCHFLKGRRVSTFVTSNEVVEEKRKTKEDAIQSFDLRNTYDRRIRIKLRRMKLLLLATVCGVSAASFSDSTARTLMLPLSSAAYSDTPQTCLTNQLKTAKLSKQVTLNCDYFKKDKCSGFTFYDTTRQVIGISFRGTSDTTQLIAEVTDTVFEAKVDFQDGGQTSKYFNDAFMQVWNGGMGSDFQALVKKYPSYNVWITGHSLGGALASMAAAHISANKISTKAKITLYTFGQPRTGDQKYADTHDNLVTAFRVTHSKDIVAHIPPEFMKYEHHKSEVWYDNDMHAGAPFTVCSAQEDQNCSDKNGAFNTSPDDHTHYYGLEVADYGRAGCK